MAPQVLFFALMSIALSATAQLLMKIGMTKVRLLGVEGLQLFYTIGTSIYVMGGLTLYGVSAILWLVVLSRVPLSVAYPMVALGFVIVAFLSWIVLHEHLPVSRLIGIGLIMGGVTMVGLR